MRSDNPDESKFKRICTDFPNIAILTKSATPGELQVTYAHTYVGNKSLGETVTNLVLVGSLEALTILSINAQHAFLGAGKYICIPTTKSLLCTAVGDLSKSKKLCDWAVLNAVLLPPFRIYLVVLEGETTTGGLLKKFSVKISERGL